MCILVILALRKPEAGLQIQGQAGYIVRPCVNNSNHPHGEQAAVPENDHGAEQNRLWLEGKCGTRAPVSSVSCEKSHGAAWSRE